MASGTVLSMCGSLLIEPRENRKVGENGWWQGIRANLDEEGRTTRLVVITSNIR